MPPLPLPDGAGIGGRMSRRRLTRAASVVAFLPDDEPEAGAAYVARLADRGDRFRLWSGRAIVVASDETLAAGRHTGDRAALVVLGDPEGETRRRWGLDASDAALFIADRWGQIYHADVGAHVGDLVDADEIEEWLKYLATQCAECGVPDEPGHGDWAA